MSNREQFEAWLVSEYEWANDTLNCANFIGDDETGHYIGGDYIYDGGSCGEPLFWAWRGWQANHKSLTESDRYGRQADITIENLERKVEQLAAENSSIKAMNDCLSEELRGYESDGAFDGPKMHLLWWKVETPATDAILAEVRASVVPDEATERELYEGWVMENHCISKSTLEGLRTCDGYRNSTLSGKDYNGMWLQWKLIRAAMLQGKAEQGCKVPDGWVMVPVEPTEDMCNVSHIGVDVYTGLARDDEYYSIGGVCAAKVYRAMLASAPQQESE